MSELTTALVAAWAELANVTKSRTAKIPTKAGGLYQYGYADLAAVLDQARPVLAKHGLALIHDIHADAGAVTVTAVLLHASGEERAAGQIVQHADTVQALGSAVTYARRYTTLAALGLATDDDDDGHAANQAPSLEAEERRAKWRIFDAVNHDPERARDIWQQISNELDAYDAAITPDMVAAAVERYLAELVG